VSGKLSFHDWKSWGILLQKTCRNPVGPPNSWSGIVQYTDPWLMAKKMEIIATLWAIWFGKGLI